MAKKSSIASVKRDGDGGTVAFTFSNGKEVSVNVAEVNTSLIDRMVLRGLSDTIRDSYAANEGVDDAYEIAAETIERVKNGTYAERKAGEPSIGLLVAAIARLKKKPEANVKAIVSEWPEDVRKQARADLTVKAAMSEIRAERDTAAAKDAPSFLDSVKL